MKHFLLLFLLGPLFSYSQDCKLIRDTDPFTKEIKLSTGFMYFSGASLSIDADSREVDLLFSIEGANRCFDDQSTAVIHFEGTKVKMSLRNAGTMNCEGLYHFIYKNAQNTTAQLQKLTTQKVSQIVFTGTNKKEVVVLLTPKDQELLISLGTCLVNEAKKLIH